MALDLRYPFGGRWRVQNSPADRVPSHGTRRFATSYAIDFVPVADADRTAPFTVVSLLRPEPPERFPGFGRPVLAPVSGTVAAVHEGESDHAAFRGVPSIGYALTQGRRAAAGWVHLAGNHVAIDMGHGGPFVVLCHLRCGSITVRAGAPITAGDPLGECGNSGNSTEPHLHVQAMDDLDPLTARALPIGFEGGLPRSGAVVSGAGRPGGEHR